MILYNYLNNVTVNRYWGNGRSLHAGKRWKWYPTNRKILLWFHLLLNRKPSYWIGNDDYGIKLSHVECESTFGGFSFSYDSGK